MSEGPVSKRKLNRRARRNLAIVATCILLGLVAGFVGFNYLSGSEDLLQEVDADKEAQAVAGRPYARSVADYFQTITNDLIAYAASDTTRNLFLSDVDTALETEAERAITRFNSALKLRLLRPGTYQLDNLTSPPLGYASMAILKKAETSSGPIAAEALLSGTDNQHIVMVARVKNQADELIGLIHLSLNSDLLRQSLSELDLDGRYIEIWQTTSGAPLILASAGDHGLKSGEPGTNAISGTRWGLAYWGPSTAVGSASLPAIPAGMSVIALAIVILGLILFMAMGRRTKKTGIDSLDKPDISYAGAIKAIMDGDHPGLEKLVAHLPGKQGTAEFVAGISEGLDGEDDITSFIKEDDLKSTAGSGEVFDITQASDEPAAKPAGSTTKVETMQDTEHKTLEIPQVIFRKYDIRGVVGKSLTPEIVEKIGLAVGTEADEHKLKIIVVGRDGRNSSPELAASLIKGLQATGRDVIDIGIVPTPVLYFATHHLKTGSGVMVTGSHNGPEYNGLKIMLDGLTLSEERINGLYERIKSGKFSSGSGNLSTAEVIQDYIRRITDDIPVALGHSLKLVVDCGNGAASVVAPQLYRAMGHDVTELYCELDGNFPNHHPDPSQPENLEAIIAKIRDEQADLGFAFDGDGDRLGLVDGDGNVLWPDRQMMVFARDVLSRNPGAEIIFDVKCSSHLKKIIESSGGKALMWKTGHSLIKSKMKEVKAPLAGEMSGHIFFGERWYGFDDALYSGARMLEIIINSKLKPSELFADLPGGVSTPELKIDMPEAEHQKFMSLLEAKISFEDAEIVTIDGFRVEFSDGWGLIRPSNTTPCLVVRFEADNAEALARIQSDFKKLLQSIKPDLTIPF